MMQSLKSYIGKPFLIKLVGQDPTFGCTLEAIDEYGIWVTDPKLMQCLGGVGAQFDLAFLSYQSIQYMVTVRTHTEPRVSSI